MVIAQRQFEFREARKDQLMDFWHHAIRSKSNHGAQAPRPGHSEQINRTKSPYPGRPQPHFGYLRQRVNERSARESH